MSAPVGTVANGTGGVWRVLGDDGIEREAVLRGRLKKVDTGRRADGSIRRDTVAAAAAVPKLAVGDRVRLERDARAETWAIAEVLPRKSRLARRAPGGGHGERVIAANLDQAIIMFAAAKPDPHPRMLDRFLVIAEANELAPRVIINKIELVGAEHARATFLPYEEAGYPVHYISVKQQLGLDDVRAALENRVSVVSGPSGVGKSSLLNALFPGLGLRVSEISESVNKGRHTTVGAFLHALTPERGPQAGAVVDTPGLREIGLWELAARDIDLCFPEMRERRNECRFADCAHIAEPGCAIRSAVDAGLIPATRYDSYLKLRAEVEEQKEY